MYSSENAIVTVYRLCELNNMVSIVFPIYPESHANSLNATINANKSLVHKVPSETNLSMTFATRPYETE